MLHQVPLVRKIGSLLNLDSVPLKFSCTLVCFQTKRKHGVEDFHKLDETIRGDASPLAYRPPVADV